MLRISITTAICLLFSVCTTNAYETSASQVLLLDDTTNTVLFEKNATEIMVPSSMSKLMTLYLLFEQLKNDYVSLDDTYPVSKKAWKKGGSKMFVEVGKRVKIEDLIRGIIVQSGNDACIVVAEGIAGSENAFAKLMNKKAKELGLQDSNFANATGWPDPNHTMTAKDLASLGQQLIHDFPEYVHYFKETEFTYSNIKQYNRNRILHNDEFDVDGLKTGHTREGGYGVVVSAHDDSRRLVLVVNGLESDNDRVVEANRLLRYGFRRFANHHLFTANEGVDAIPVTNGKQETVTVITKNNIEITLPKADKEQLQVKVQYAPLSAPIKKGENIAYLEVSFPGRETKTYPLYADQDIEATFFTRVKNRVKQLF